MYLIQRMPFKSIGTSPIDKMPICVGWQTRATMPPQQSAMPLTSHCNSTEHQQKTKNAVTIAASLLKSRPQCRRTLARTEKTVARFLCVYGGVHLMLPRCPPFWHGRNVWHATNAGGKERERPQGREALGVGADTPQATNISPAKGDTNEYLMGA